MLELDRNKTRGEFKERAAIAQGLKNALRWQNKWGSLSDEQKEALEAIMDKVSIILNGDPDCQKTWDAISAYAKLIGNSLTREPANQSNLPAGEQDRFLRSVM